MLRWAAVGWPYALRAASLVIEQKHQHVFVVVFFGLAPHLFGFASPVLFEGGLYTLGRRNERRHVDDLCRCGRRIGNVVNNVGGLLGRLLDYLSLGGIRGDLAGRAPDDLL